MKKWIAGISAAALMLSAAGTAVAAPAEDAPVLDCSTLVTFGDSLTALSSWPQDAAKELNMYLVNAGIGGHTSANALARFDRDVASKDPDFDHRLWHQRLRACQWHRSSGFSGGFPHEYGNHCG